MVPKMEGPAEKLMIPKKGNLRRKLNNSKNGGVIRVNVESIMGIT